MKTHRHLRFLLFLGALSGGCAYDTRQVPCDPTTGVCTGPDGTLAGFDQTTTRVDAEGRIYTRDPNVVWGGACTGEFPVDVTTPEGATTVRCNGGTWLFTETRTDADGEKSYTVSQTDGSAITRIALVWVLDRAAPVAASIVSTNGNAVTSAFLPVAVEVADALSPIDAICLQFNATSVAADNDPRWIAVTAAAPGTTPSRTLDLDEVFLALGRTPGAYHVTVRYRDRAGNASLLAGNTLGTPAVDSVDVTLTLGNPPRARVVATRTGTPSTPLIDSDLTIAAGQDVVIQWVITDDKSLPTGAVRIVATTDDRNWTLIPGTFDVDTQSGCTATPPFLGCVRITATTSAYFKIRIYVRDSDQQTTLADSPPVNVAPFAIIAGNLSSGMGGSARAMLLDDRSRLGDQRSGDPGWFVVARNGDIYVRDRNHGIIRIDGATGAGDIFIDRAATSTGDGGPAASATVADPTTLALGFDDTLLIYDSDRIRCVDLASPDKTIITLIGGGTATDNAEADARAIALQRRSDQLKSLAIVPLPDGRIVFRSDQQLTAPLRLRVYDPTTGRVSTVVLRGTGLFDQPSQDVSVCPNDSFAVRFDPVSSEIQGFVIKTFQSPAPSTCASTDGSYRVGALRFDATGALLADTLPLENSQALTTGRDGKVYRYAPRAGSIAVAADDLSAWVTIVNANASAPCADDGPIATCAIRPTDLHALPDGSLYYAEAGVVRAISRTLFNYPVAGERAFAGDGFDALTARFREVSSVDFHRADGHLTIAALDIGSVRFREVQLNTNIITTIAGNGLEGDIASGAAATASPLNVRNTSARAPLFVLDRASGDVYYQSLATQYRLVRSTGQWAKLGGDGATPYDQADGQALGTIALDGYDRIVQPMGANGTSMLIGGLNHRPTPYAFADSQINAYTFASLVQSTVLKATGAASTSWCAIGTALTACNTPRLVAERQQRASYDTDLGWIVADGAGTSFYALKPATGAVVAQAFPRPMLAPTQSFAYVGGSQKYVYYCDAGGKLHNYDLATSTDLTVRQPPNVLCTGNAMVHDPLLDQIYVPVVTSEGVAGIARAR